ncbi:MAG: DUF1684 domain-containing protein [Bacteroidota bacterium]
MPVSYLPEHTNWEEARLQNLYADEGWLNLAGLYWMEPGEYTFGSDSSNDLVFPVDFPQEMGSFFVTTNRVLLTSESTEITVDGSPLDGPTVVYDETNEANAEMVFGDYRWFVINRADNLGVRLRNLQHPALHHQLDIPKYPTDYRWVVEASYVPYDTPKSIAVENILGFRYQMQIPGQLQFEIEGKAFTLEPIQEGDEFFIIFSDETSAVETYGSGRYMYADMPQGTEGVTLDFNKCYNPPCAFTDYATCLIPPPENQLALAIRAGEKDFHMP